MPMEHLSTDHSPLKLLVSLMALIALMNRFNSTDSTGEQNRDAMKEVVLSCSAYNNFEEVRQPEETSNLVDYSIKSVKQPVKGKLDMKTLIPKIPKHIQVYIAVAFSERDFPSYSKIFNKTLSSIPNSFLITDSVSRHYNVSVSPLFFVLPNSGRFSSSIYEVMCSSFDRKRVVGILVMGESPAAFTVSLAAVTSNIPVLWARGGIPNPPGSLQQQDPLEIRLEPGEIQLLEAVRGVFLATHWHSFTVMAAPSLAARCASILNLPPLNPKVVPIMRNPHNIFRKMADVSRSTRGVVLLLCDLSDAILVMDVAKRLNMIDGHFVWIWIDTTTKPASFLTLSTSSNHNFTQKFTRYLDRVSKTRNSKSGLPFQSDGPSSRPNASANSKIKKMSERTSRGAKKIRKRDTMPRTGSEGFEWKIRKQRFAPVNESNEAVGNGTGGEQSRRHSEQKIKKIEFLRQSKAGVVLNLENLRNNSDEDEDDDDNSNSNHSNSKNFSALKQKPVEIPETAEKSKSPPAQELRPPAKGQNTKSCDTKAKKDPARWEDFASMDYLNDFAVQLDHPAEREVEEVDKTQVPASKAWGRITEHFPVRSLHRKDDDDGNLKDTDLPIGLLSVKPEPVKLDRHLIKGSVRLLVSSLHTVLKRSADWLSILDTDSSCWVKPSPMNKNFSDMYAKEVRQAVKEALSGQLQFQDGDRADRSLTANFQILNLVPEKFNVNFYNDVNVIEEAVLYWRQVGKVMGRTAQLNTIVWPGGDLVASALSARTRSVFRIVTALAPPFVMEGALDEDGQCLRGVICHRVLNSDKDNLTLVFNEMDTQERMEDEVEELGGDEKTEKPFRFIDHNYFEFHNSKYKYKSSCCYGLAMDLLENVAQELEFEFHLYIVPDGAYGAKNHVWEQGGPRTKWNGIVGDLVSGAAHMSFAALSVSKQRSQVIDFSTPYFFSGVSFLAAPTQKSEVPLLAFLLPFSTELWIAIFTSLNITAMAVACYEWLSPFGLNPWGRQRSRNFSIASALWVMWGLLCGHLVAFKAPKSWPNKFLINVWGGFSVIFVASYTANIAALIAGLFFHNSVSDYHDRSLLTQRVGAPKSSSADYYIHRANQHLWEHMQKYSFKDVETGIALLRNGSLDILISDTPILDYYRATDHGCKLQKIVEAINEDTYAIGMNKGFPLKESISAVISKYSNNGYMDILTEKWYGGLPCFKMTPSVELTDVGQPRPLGVAAVAGVFLLLGLGMVVGVLILILEHLFYRYTLPVLRHQPKGTIWRSRNIMFFSQKLYRFINCVELVSPHHAARELVHTLRQGQITSLFQKSVKRLVTVDVPQKLDEEHFQYHRISRNFVPSALKEHEQRRRRKSKAQFFEMIQEIRRVQQEEKEPKQVQNVSEGIESSPKVQLRGFLTSPRSLKHLCSSKSSVSPQLSVDLAEPLNPSELVQQRRSSKSPSRLDIRRFSKELFSLPRSPKSPKAKSSTSLDVRRFSSDLEENKKRGDVKISNVRSSAKDIRVQSSNAIGRRLSKDSSSWLTSSPPDLNSRRKSHLDIMHTKSLSVSENVLDDTPKSALDLKSANFLAQNKYNEYGKEVLSKSMTLTPVISKAATIRLASSGSLNKSVKTRPRLPSPPKSPVMDFKSPKTPKISISDADDTLNIYDTILPKDEINPKKPTKASHSRSRSLDNKHLNFGATIVDIENPDEKHIKADKQTVSYATLEHKKNNFGDEVKAKNVNEKLKTVNISKEKQFPLEGKGPFGKKVATPTIDINKTLGKDFVSVRNNLKDAELKSETSVTALSTANNLKTDVQSIYAEPIKPKRDKKEEKTTPLKKSQGDTTEHTAPTKPKIPPKNNALKHKQARAYSAPESGDKPPPTVVFLTENTLRTHTFPEYNYYSEHKKFQKSESFPDRCREVRCTQRCFETFPIDRRCTGASHSEPHHLHYHHRSRNDSDRRSETTARSRSVPEQRYIVTATESKSEDRAKRKTEGAVIVLQHCSRSLDTPSRNPGILKNRRRSRSRDEIDLPPAPPSPPDRKRRHERSEPSGREMPTVRKGGQGYLDPP